MATRKKSLLKKKVSILSPAEHYFVYGEIDPRELTPDEARKLYNPFEMLDLMHPRTTEGKAKVERLNLLRPATVVRHETIKKIIPSRTVVEVPSVPPWCR